MKTVVHKDQMRTQSLLIEEYRRLSFSGIWCRVDWW